MTYRSGLPEDQAARIRQWHEGAYAAAQAEAATGAHRTMTYLDRTFTVPPDVMPITGVSHLLGRAVLDEVRDTDRVLDMGTGCGVNAVLAASRAREVLAVDINPHALAAARRNAEHNGVADRVTVRHSDVFSSVDGTFDLMIFDPPFRWFPARTHLEAAMTDDGYQAMTRFFTGARDHLAAGGRMLIFFGTSGDLSYLQGLIDETGFDTEVLARHELTKDGWPVEYFTFRLTT